MAVAKRTTYKLNTWVVQKRHLDSTRLNSSKSNNPIHNTSEVPRGKQRYLQNRSGQRK